LAYCAGWLDGGRTGRPRPIAPATPAPRVLERHIGDRGDEQRQQLGGQQPADDRDAEQLAELGAGSEPERDRQRARRRPKSPPPRSPPRCPCSADFQVSTRDKSIT